MAFIAAQSDRRWFFAIDCGRPQRLIVRFRNLSVALRSRRKAREDLERAIEIMEWVAHGGTPRNLAKRLKPIYPDNGFPWADEKRYDCL